MNDENEKLVPKGKQKKTFGKTNIPKEKNFEAFVSSPSTWKIKCRVIVFIVFACLTSITIAAKIRFTPMVSETLSVVFHNGYSKTQLNWIGRLYAIISLCLLPVTTSTIDHNKVGYRFALIISGCLHLVASVTSASTTHPLFFILTDSFLCALGSAITFSVIILAVDDIFPKGNVFRVPMTTLCQGSAIGSLFILDGMAYVSKQWGWMGFQLSLASIFALEAIMMIVFCPEYGIRIRVKQRGGPQVEVPEVLSLETPINSTDLHPVFNKWLGLTFNDINNSPSLFPFMLYRFLMNIIEQGIFTLILLDSKIITTPEIETLISINFAPTLATLVYTSSETFIYILGAVFGYFLLGYLLHINILLLCVLFLVTVIWQPVRIQMLAKSMVLGHVVCAGLTGACIGGLTTCLIPVIEEGTNLRSRRIFPFVKLNEGLALTFSQFLFQILNKVTEQNIWLLTFAVMAAANACILVFILHKLYIKYLSNKKERNLSIHVSMKPAHFFYKGSESN